MRAKNLQKTSTFTDLIYKEIKKSILDGNLRPGQRLKVREIARNFNASITPVREAIQRLSAEDYLILNARSEVKVKSDSFDEIKEKLELIRVLDRYELEKTLPSFPLKALKKLKDLTLTLGEYYKQNNIKGFCRLSLEIHHHIWKTYESKSISHILIQASERVSILENKNLGHYYSPKEFHRSYQEHCELIESLESKDLKKALKVMSSHFSVDYLKE